jgi:hypothetical protein
MPTLRRFRAVSVPMYADDHRPPHFHIVGPDFQVLVKISDLSIVAGEARPSQIAEALAWAREQRDACAQMGGAQRTEMIMPRKTLPRITAVTPGKKPLSLRITWDNATESEIDVSGLVETYRVYAPLRRSPDLFSKVRLGEHGTDVVWSDELDMSADTLWRLAQEQSGVTMSPEDFRHWRERKAYTLDGAARALGISRRMVAYYEQGARPIPRVVALATRALELTPSL